MCLSVSRLCQKAFLLPKQTQQQSRLVKSNGIWDDWFCISNNNEKCSLFGYAHMIGKWHFLIFMKLQQLMYLYIPFWLCCCSSLWQFSSGVIYLSQVSCPSSKRSCFLWSCSLLLLLLLVTFSWLVSCLLDTLVTVLCLCLCVACLWGV